MADATLNNLLMKVARRAENAPAEVLRSSFVPVRSLLAHLESPEHHVLFGRRGTGKTHLLRYLQDQQTERGALAIYLDLRRVNTADDAQPGELAGALLVEVIGHIHAALYEQVLQDRWAPMLAGLSDALDMLASAAKQIRVVDNRVLLGSLANSLHKLAAALAPHQLWLLLDEWSALPPEVQPLLADLLRRTFFATAGVVVKISAVHGRSRFTDPDTDDHVGLELGADTAASLDLDDFLLFRNDIASTVAFYAALLYQHLTAVADPADRDTAAALRGIDGPQRFTARLFTSPESFHNLVLGAEGVPRDALQIAGLAAGAAYEERIAPAHVATATRDFYLRDKEGNLPRSAQRVFGNLIEQCAKQRSRLIPLRRDGESNEEVIQRLYDARLIHRVRQGVSLDPQRPSEVYDVYVIDYGCFLGLLKSGRIRTVEDGLDPGARFADADEIEIRGRTFVRMPAGWYRPSDRRKAR
jgi:hypothetical protein